MQGLGDPSAPFVIDDILAEGYSAELLLQLPNVKNTSYIFTYEREWHARRAHMIPWNKAES
jgi:hypothetical protein